MHKIICGELILSEGKVEKGLPEENFWQWSCLKTFTVQKYDVFLHLTLS